MSLSRVLNPIKNRLSLIVGRAIINLINDTQKVQTAQIDLLNDETHDDAERFTEYGFASRPPKGTEAIVLSLGGVRSNGVIIATNNRQYRLKLNRDGDVGLFNDIGDKITLTNDGIKLETGNKITIISPTTNIDGDVHCTGTISADIDVFADGKSLKSHKHLLVKTGTDKSGAPE